MNSASSQRTVLAVTGASGHLGRLVLQHLRRLHAGPLVAISRRPQQLAGLAAQGVDTRAGDFDDPATLTRAFAGVTRLLVISTDAHDIPGRRLQQHENALRAARECDVRHVLYTSLTRCEPGSPMKIAPDHWATEQALTASGLPHTVLRNNLYAEIVMEFLPQALKSGILHAAAGSGAVAWVTRDDVARVAAVATYAPPPERVLDVTGGAPIRYEELAGWASRIDGRPLVYQPVPPTVMAQGMARAGLPPHVVDVLLSFQLAAAQGDLALCTDVVRRLTGRAPQPLPDFLRQRADALRGSRS